ncbi:MAG: oxygen-independent coproporphyrinogen III oxidase [Verrucomicrobiota bacterium]
MIANPQAIGSSSIDSALVSKYNRPAPRYTSYPTALQFRVIDDPESQEAMYTDSESGGPLSLYFHLPFCKSLCWFCGCTKIISTDVCLADRYIDYLEKEIAMVRPKIASDRKAVQLHFGGGSPNFLIPEQIDRLSSLIHDHFEFEEGAEISVELDPRTLTKEKVDAFRRMGMNRASMGVQDLNPKVQEAIHRIQPSDMNRQAIAWLEEAGIHKLNIDLIYGLPRQTVESFSETLEEVLEYDPDRLAIFSYAHVPWSKPAQRILERNPMPNAQEKVGILERIVEALLDAGYAHIGMDHFAKQWDALALAQKEKKMQRNFQGYSLHKDVEICSFGISAISQTDRTYRQNVKELETYYRLLDMGRYPIDKGYLMSRDDSIRRKVIMRLMCDMELDFEAMSKELDIDFRDYFRKEIRALVPLERDGLLDLHPGGIKVLTTGRLLIRNVAVAFDAYFGKGASGFSRAV